MNIYSPFQAVMKTPCGVLGIHCTAEALTGISFLSSSSKAKLPRDAFTREVCAQLQAYFDSSSYKFNLPLNFSGTAHQLKVWQAMCEIPRGQVQTYGELAAALHSSPRAIGQACGNNPIPIVIPCHRVVSKTGLGGFMHSKDNSTLDIKRWLLAHEALAPSPLTGEGWGEGGL